MDEDENKVSVHFNNQLNQSLTTFSNDNYINLDENDKSEIIKKLYNLNQQIKSNNFDKTEYSLSFFKELEKSIKNAGELQKKNLNNRLEEFFLYTDDLFQKELKQESEKEKDIHRQYLQKIDKEIIPKANAIFDISERNIINYIDDGKNKSLKLINNEIINIKDKLQNAKNDVKIAANNLENEIKISMEIVNDDIKKEILDLIKNIQILFGQNLKGNFSKKNIDATKDIKVSIPSLFSTSLHYGLGLFGESLFLGAASTIEATAVASLACPLGAILAFGIGISISVFSLISDFVKKEKRYLKGLEKFQKEINKLFVNSKISFLDNFNLYKVEFFKNISMKIMIKLKEINKVDEKKWEEIKNNYKEIKNNIMKKIKSLDFENDDDDTKINKIK